MKFVVESSLNQTFNLGFQFNLFLESIFMWPLRIYPKNSIANTAIKILWVLTDSLEYVYIKSQTCIHILSVMCCSRIPEWLLHHFLNQFPSRPLCCWYQSCYK